MSSIIPKEPAARVAMAVLALLGFFSGAGTERYSGKPVDETVLQKAVSTALAESETIKDLDERLDKLQSSSQEHELRIAMNERAVQALPTISDALTRLDERLAAVLNDKNDYKRIKGMYDVTQGKPP